MIYKTLKDITEADIDLLLTNKVEESRTIEYKQILPITNVESEKEKFLADVAALANSIGGDIVYGIEEDKSLPKSIPGLTFKNYDQEVRRLTECLNSGLDPRVSGFEFEQIDRANLQPVIVLRVPHSWQAPHRLISNSRFYSRHSKGNIIMDTRQIREAFFRSEGITEKIQKWKQDRVILHAQGHGKLGAHKLPIFIMHATPIVSFSDPPALSMKEIFGQYDLLRPFGNYGGHRKNLDGLETHDQETELQEYTQTYRNGTIEAATVKFAHEHDSKIGLLGLPNMAEIICAVERYTMALRNMHIDGPIIFHFSIVGANGATLPNTAYSMTPLDRALIELPSINVEKTADIPSALKDTFDALWNAANALSCPFYDANGSPTKDFTKWIAGTRTQ